MQKLRTKIQCPNCKRRINILIQEMVPGRSKQCSCGTLIHFSGGDGRKIQRSIDKLERDLKRLSRRIRF